MSSMPEPVTAPLPSPPASASSGPRRLSQLPPTQLPPAVTAYQPVNADSPGFAQPSFRAGDGPDTPSFPETSKLLPSSAQYAPFNTEELYTPPLKEVHSSATSVVQVRETWVPIPLRNWFWIPFVCVLVGGAIALEIALHFSNKKRGWSTKQSAENGVLHYVYTLPSVAVAMAVVGLWAWTDVEVKRLQPYVDLVHGDSPAQRSLLLDYTRTHNSLVWMNATVNKHYLVALTSLMALVALAFQPLAAALFTVRDTWWTLPDTAVTNTQSIGLNQDQQFQDLTSFLGASGFASSKILYGLGDSPFVRDGYSVGTFNIPLNLATNGTISANTTAILNDPGCRNPDQPVSMVEHPDGTGWNNSAVFSGCAFAWEVDKSAVHLFGAETMPPCASFPATDQSFAPAIFWFFTYQPQPSASVSLCAPTITLQNVAVTVDIATQNLTSVTPISALQAGDGPLAANAASVIALHGQAFNGMNWSASQVVFDPFVTARAQAIQLQLPAAVFQNAVQSPEGLDAAFTNNAFATLSTTVYRTYLTMLSRVLYFVPVNTALPVRVQTIKKRLWLSAVAVHLLAVGMLVLAFFATIIQILHRYDRQDLHLQHQPGTLASAAAFTAQTPMATLLDGRQRGGDIASALRDRKFRIDRHTMKVVMESEAGYDDAPSPGWRKSTFGSHPPWFRRSKIEEGEGSLPRSTSRDTH